MFNKTEDEIIKNWKSGYETPLVSICCATYNHQNYISEAIESFLMQETDFPFEIIIRDDASTDGTTEIVKTYSDKYQSIIKPIFEKENQFSKGIKPHNVMFEHAKGKYIALCEGDDYWTDPLKLQKQVNFLEENDDISLVHTDYDWLDMASGNIVKNYYQKNRMYFLEKYAKEIYFVDTYIRTMTVCFCKSDMDGYEKILNNNWKLGDVPLFLYLAREKNIGFINQSTGIYRRSKESVSSSRDANRRFDFWMSVMEVRFFFYNYFNFHDDSIKNELLNQYNDGLFIRALDAKKYNLFYKALIYKIKNKRLKKNDFKIILYSIYRILNLTKLKKIIENTYKG